MINWERVKELEEDIGPDDIGDIIELFLSEVESVILRLSSALATDTLEEDMHFLKGSALNLGFDVLGNLCSVAEKMASKGQSNDINVQKIITSFESSKLIFLDRMQAA